jgi:DNA topoisomerase-1
MIINRTGNAPSFTYESKGERVKNPSILEYIKSLTIPPMYSNVEIHISLSGKLPVAPPKLTYTGIDDKGRTQYGYSKAWKDKSKKKKYKSLIAFGTALPNIRKSINETLSMKITNILPSRELCIAVIIRIIMTCHFRLGNLKYKNMYKSYGITNIEVRHVKFKNNIAKISFIGKKGVKNDCTINDSQTVAHLKHVVKGKRQNDPIFAYDSGGDECTTPIMANDINEWMKQFGVDITSKMFRTYATNVMFIDIMQSMEAPEGLSLSQRKKNINNVMDDVSCSIHNTRAVCKKEYTHPGLIEMYLDHPRRFKKLFMSGLDPEPSFLTFLRTN